MMTIIWRGRWERVVLRRVGCDLNRCAAIKMMSNAILVVKMKCTANDAFGISVWVGGIMYVVQIFGRLSLFLGSRELGHQAWKAPEKGKPHTNDRVFR